MFPDGSDIRPNSTIIRQHNLIKALLDALSSRFDTERTISRSTVSLLNSLAAHLEFHFELEEEEEYFGGILIRAPRLSAYVDELVSQHKAMRNEVEQLVSISRTALAENLNVDELASRFRLFHQQLLDHEKAEIGLIQEAYTRGLGDKD